VLRLGLSKAARKAWRKESRMRPNWARSIEAGSLGATLGAAVGYDWVGLRTDDAVGHGTDNGFHRHSHHHEVRSQNVDLDAFD
jgi:hypothetical protein